MKNISRMIVIIISFGISSCATVYVPNAVNAPMLDKASNVQISAYGGNRGFDVQTAAAITDNIAIMANGAYLNEVNDTADYEKRKFGEVALGYYHPFGEKFRFECFAGYGVGKASDWDTEKEWIADRYHTDYVEGNYSRIFIQPSLGIKSELVDLGFAMRISHVKIYSIKENYLGDYKTETMYYEPAIIGRIGFPMIRFSCQLGFSFSSDNTIFNHHDLNLSAGVTVNLFN